jgi:acetyltransferase-like isoleucine patch superfamily enzyme
MDKLPVDCSVPNSGITVGEFVFISYPVHIHCTYVDPPSHFCPSAASGAQV